MEDQPDAIQQYVKPMSSYIESAASGFGAWVAHNPNEFIIAVSAAITVVFTGVLAVKTAGLFKATADLRDATRGMVKFAEEQARDMKTSIAAGRDSADATIAIAAADRAWMGSGPFQVSYVTRLTIDDAEHADGYLIQARWINSGRSPAVRLESVISIKVVALDGPIPSFVVSDPDEDRSGMVAPNMAIGTVEKAIAGDDFRRIGQREVRCFIYSRVTYGTVSEPNRRHHSEICALVEYNGERIQPDGSRIPNLGFSPMGAQNTAS